jgi:hypothetical protein
MAQDFVDDATRSGLAHWEYQAQLAIKQSNEHYSRNNSADIGDVDDPAAYRNQIKAAKNIATHMMPLPITVILTLSTDRRQ